jgi:hypothetical protein
MKAIAVIVIARPKKNQKKLISLLLRLMLIELDYLQIAKKMRFEQ